MKLLLILILSLLGAPKANSRATLIVTPNNLNDSLLLSATQKAQLNTIHLQLSSAKSAVRAQYTNRDTVLYKMQKIEDGRDSLYRAVLTATQFNLYKQKHGALGSAN